MTVMIGIDPHKRSHTAVALDEHDKVLAELRIDAHARQVERLLGWAEGWPERIWAIENANGLGWLLERQLLEVGEQVRDVPAALSAQVRKLSGSGHKTDAHDARSTAIAGRHAHRLCTVVPNGPPQVRGVAEAGDRSALPGPPRGRRRALPEPGEPTPDEASLDLGSSPALASQRR